MPFKSWSAAEGSHDKPLADDKAKAAPAAAEPVAQPDKPPEKSPVQEPPLRKS